MNLRKEQKAFQYANIIVSPYSVLNC